MGVLFGRDLLLDATVRATRANQTGLLGFGSARHNGYRALFEGSTGVLLDEHTVVGFEYRQKPDNLHFAREDDWADFFIAYFPTKHIALAAAYAALGSIAGLPSQHGLYLSLQASL